MLRGLGHRTARGRRDEHLRPQTRTIALPPPARDVLLRRPTRSGELVFLQGGHAAVAANAERLLGQGDVAIAVASFGIFTIIVAPLGDQYGI